jgi:hypothetical protein
MRRTAVLQLQSAFGTGCSCTRPDHPFGPCTIALWRSALCHVHRRDGVGKLFYVAQATRSDTRPPCRSVDTLACVFFARISHRRNHVLPWRPPVTVTNPYCRDDPARGEVLRYFRPTMAKKRAKKTFSTVKAVKANARDRVGQPKPERVIDETVRAKKRQGKHKQTLADLLGTE